MPRSRRERATCSPVAPRLRPSATEPAYDPKLNTGILGTRYLLEVLADNGETDIAYEVLAGEEYPSWGHWFAGGRVSLGEAWEQDARSWSHHMFGSIDVWFYQHLAGIRPAAPGFAEIAITPHLPAALETATATVGTPVGEVRSSWKKDGEGGYEFEFDIPEGARATFALPQGVPGIDVDDARMKQGLPLPAGRSAVRIMAGGEVVVGELVEA